MTEPVLPTYSWSRVSMYSRCAYQFYKRYIEEKIIPPGIAMLTGTGVHAGAECNLNHKIKEGEAASIAECSDATRDKINNEWDDTGVFLRPEEKTIGEKKLRGKVIDEAVTLSSVHHDIIAPQILYPVTTEEIFELSVPDAGFNLTGVIDVVEQDGKRCIIHDHKTASKSPSKTACDDNGQLTMYALSKKIMQGEIPEVAMNWCIKTKTPKATMQYSKRSASQLMGLLQHVQMIHDSIQKGVFNYACYQTPSPWFCNKRFCGYYDTCPGIKGKLFI